MMINTLLKSIVSVVYRWRWQW